MWKQCEFLQPRACSCSLVRVPAASCVFLQHRASSRSLFRVRAVSCEFLQSCANSCSLMRVFAASCEFVQSRVSSCSLVRVRAVSCQFVAWYEEPGCDSHCQYGRNQLPLCHWTATSFGISAQASWQQIVFVIIWVSYVNIDVAWITGLFHRKVWLIFIWAWHSCVCRAYELHFSYEID
jgi:hypothetical protein